MQQNESLYGILDEVVYHPDERFMNRDSYGNNFACFSKYIGNDMGISVCGCFMEENRFRMEYYYPFFIGSNVTTRELVEVERHASNESCYGICDELKMGIPLIFYINNLQDVFPKVQNEEEPVLAGHTIISGMAERGKILFPIMKNRELARIKQKSSDKRMNLMMQARDGDRSAMENLTLNDMDIYAAISRRVEKEDILSIVESSIVPYGVESDQYTVIGEIEKFRTVRNVVTDENVMIFKLLCNGLHFDVCINEKDLYGEPEIGRRFKGRIWMQGHVSVE
ncbi:MAG: DUF3881 family protein [Clostridiales bacterium]|nr:DUF3881 family protein [Clostridiales bacterium]